MQRFGQVLAADGVILGSSVRECKYTSRPPKMDQMTHGMGCYSKIFPIQLVRHLSQPCGLSAGEEGTHEQSDSDNDDIPNMIIVGGNSWLCPFWCIGDHL